MDRETSSAAVGEPEENPETVCLARLPARELLLVDTLNSQYRIVPTEPATRHARIQGGPAFAQPTPVTIVGATSGYGFLKPGWIDVGMGIEILTRDRRLLVTSAVSAIHVTHRVEVDPDETAESRPAEQL